MSIELLKARQDCLVIAFANVESTLRFASGAHDEAVTAYNLAAEELNKLTALIDSAVGQENMPEEEVDLVTEPTNCSGCGKLLFANTGSDKCIKCQKGNI